MSRNTYRTRLFTCLEPSCGHLFRSGWWAAKLTGASDRQFETRGDVRCPQCSSHNVEADRHIERLNSKPVRLRESDRLVVYRWHDSDGHEHFAYPSTNDLSIRPQRAGEERVEFDTLRAAERFTKTQDDFYAHRTTPLNDIFDYDERSLQAVALDETDPGIAEDLEAATEQEAQGGSGVATEAEVGAFMSQTSGQALIESI